MTQGWDDLEMVEPPALAQELKITEQTLARWRIEGQGPRAYRVGRAVRYRRSDIERWLESRAIPQGAA